MNSLIAIPRAYASTKEKEEAEFERKFVDFNKYRWPEENTIELIRPED